MMQALQNLKSNWIQKQIYLGISNWELMLIIYLFTHGTRHPLTSLSMAAG